MSSFEEPSDKKEDRLQEQGPKNPNDIGSMNEMLSLGEVKVPTSPDSVYRMVAKKEAIEDLFSAGVVRNSYSAGAGRERKFGEKVFWTQGKDGMSHSLMRDAFLIQAPMHVAAERQVTQNDIEAIYQNREGQIVEILQERDLQQKEAKEARASEQIVNEEKDQARIQEILGELGVDPKKDEPEK